MSDIRAVSEKIVSECEKIIVGKHEKLRLIVMALLADGHILLDDLPGVGKTTLVKTLARALGCESRRVQFVPDLLPSDISGMQIYDRRTGEFRLVPGPVMTNLLLADEINRAIPRTQSALLEAMEERQVTIEGETLALPRPFLVLATQNPVESESTFPLPAAQLDRFLIRISLGYPEEEDERRMVRSLADAVPFERVNAVTCAEELTALQTAANGIYVAEGVERYLVAICRATRTHPKLTLGASPRASRALYRACRVWAAMEGRDFVTSEDVQRLAEPVLLHRLSLSADARFGGLGADAVLRGILESVPVTPDPAESLRG